MKKLLSLLASAFLLAACGNPDGSTQAASGGGGNGKTGCYTDGYDPSTDPSPPWDDRYRDGCDVTEPPAGGDTSVSSGDMGYGDGGGNVKPHPKKVKPRPGMADVHPLGWDEAKVSNSGRKVTLVFYSGVEPCYVLDHVDVRYNENDITLTMYEGHDPEAGEDVACIEIAQLKATKVHLNQPAGEREIVDGAD